LKQVIIAKKAFYKLGVFLKNPPLSFSNLLRANGVGFKA